jgi:hypothetical protein
MRPPARVKRERGDKEARVPGSNALIFTFIPFIGFMIKQNLYFIIFWIIFVF